MASVLVGCLSHTAMQAQDGALDSTFGIDGVVIYSLPTDQLVPQSLLIQPDGSKVVAGYSSAIKGLFFARFLTDGMLDLSFGTEGYTHLQLGVYEHSLQAIALQDDGKLVAAGYYNNGSHDDLAVVRLHPDGSLDTTFGEGGLVFTDLGIETNERAYAIAIQSDQNIVVAGYHAATGSNKDFMLARYLPDGTLDGSFNGTGWVATDLSTGPDEALAIALDEDEHILVAGNGKPDISRVLYLLRYKPDGSLDPDFGAEGMVSPEIAGPEESANAIAIQSDGKIVLAGYLKDTKYAFLTTRFNADGSLDETFADGGVAATSLTTEDDQEEYKAYAVLIQRNGKIVVGGYSKVATFDFGLIRLHTDGVLDDSFGAGGVVINNLGDPSSDNRIYSLVQQEDGKIVAAGTTSYYSSLYEVCIARYFTDETVAITAPPSLMALQVFPNPIVNSVTLSWPKELQQATLTIYDILGYKVYVNYSVSGNQLTLENCQLPSGIFMLTLQENNYLYATGTILVAALD